MPTLMSLEQFARQLGLDPLHLFGGSSRIRSAQPCYSSWVEQPYLAAGGATSRQELRQAIEMAESQIARLCNYWPGTVYSSEDHPLVQRRPVFLSRWGQVQALSSQSIAFLDTATYTSSDPDGDGWDEWATFTLAGQAGREVRAYYKDYAAGDDSSRPDPASSGADPTWEIRPIYALDSGADLMVGINRWHLLKPQLTWMQSEPIDADDPNNFVDALAFYVVEDVVEPLTFYWDADGSTLSINGYVVNGAIGRIEADRLFPSPPSRVRLKYKHGLSQPRHGMLLSFWANLVTILAVSNMPWPLCQCSNIASFADYWREEFDEGGYNCPWGIRRGQIFVHNALCAGGHRQAQGIMA